MLSSTFRTLRTRSDAEVESRSLRTRAFDWTLSASSQPRPNLLGWNHDTARTQQDEPDLRELNNALFALAEIFPDIRPDVFREILGSLSEESRLHVVADQLLNSGAKWIQGRWRIRSKVSSSKILSEVLESEGRVLEEVKEPVPLVEQFRTTTYKAAAKTALEDEFRYLSRTTIEGVLAEQNFSYKDSRPVLTGLAAKSWRINFKALMRWKKTADSHFMLILARAPSAGAVYLPQLRETGSSELDHELYETVLKPILEHEINAREVVSQELAILLNNADAKANKAIYECECCFGEIAFESIAICTTGEHVLCFVCVQNTVSEALYGQAWSKTIDHDQSAMACFAPTSLECQGCIPNYLTQRALLQIRGGSKSWEKFEQKLAKDALTSTNQKYLECPFCCYAEVDEVYWASGTLQFKLKGIQELFDLLRMLLLLIIGIPFCLQYFWLSYISPLPPLKFLFARSLDLMARERCLTLKFSCQNPSCNRYSCRLCKVAWKDPHKCNEKEEVSLRTAIEAAKSAATKRVCPKCNLSFVKESGCNKMTCTCGYTMCYLCRQGLGQSANKRNQHDDHDYSHFCGHFRAFPGRCMQCEKCDLYRDANQEELIRKVGETAEKEWIARQRSGTSAQLDVQSEGTRLELRLQAFVDRIVRTFVTC